MVVMKASIPKLGDVYGGLRGLSWVGERAASDGMAQEIIEMVVDSLRAAAPSNPNRDISQAVRLTRQKKQNARTLRESLFGRVYVLGERMRFRFYANWYARFVQRGARAHHIKPRPEAGSRGGTTLNRQIKDPGRRRAAGRSATLQRPPALAFVASGGEVIVTRNVQHPGSAPNDFVQRAWQLVQPAAMAAAQEHLARTMAAAMSGRAAA